MLGLLGGSLERKEDKLKNNEVSTTASWDLHTVLRKNKTLSMIERKETKKKNQKQTSKLKREYWVVYQTEP